MKKAKKEAEEAKQQARKLQVMMAGLLHQQGKSIPEIAAAMSIDEDTVRKLLGD